MRGKLEVSRVTLRRGHPISHLNNVSGQFRRLRNRSSLPSLLTALWRQFFEFPMLFTKTQGRQGRDEHSESAARSAEEKPLTCMIYFFASQMPRNIQAVRDSRESSSLLGDKNSPVYAHRLDTLLSEIGHHAHLSPFVTHFETFPVEMPPPGRPKNTTREEMHDTMLLAKFPHKRAWEQWVMTKEWQRFMEKTEREQVFRRVPHVRCASSLRGLSDPEEVFNT